MVPSDPSTSSFPDRHARPEHGIRERRDVSPLLPAAGFMPATDQCSGARPLSRSGRSPLLDAAFRSPAATVNLAIRLRGRVNAPGLSSSKRFNHVRGSPCAFLSPFGFALPPPAGFLSPPEARSTHATRCQVRFRNSTSVTQIFRSPPGSLDPFGIKALNLIPDAEACPCESPDLPSLPAALEIISYPLRATDHRSRSATSRQARCPSNLLEPSTSCTRMSFRSTKKQTRYGALNRKYLTWNEAVTTTLA